MSRFARTLLVLSLAAAAACDPETPGQDTKAPTFDGLASATVTGASSVTLSWSAASDDVSKPEEIAYDVYSANSPGDENFATPTKKTAPGATGVVLEGFAPGETYYFIVRARDAAGNSDSNVVEKSASLTATNQAPSFGGVGTVTAQSDSAVTVTWSPATDDSTPSSGITYLVCYGATATTCTNSFNAAKTVTGVNAVVVTGLAPGLTYHFVVRARDEEGLVDPNTVVRSVTTQGDNTPPTFSGANSVDAATMSSLTVHWDAASDNATATSALVYDICRATTANGCATFTATATSAAGATSHVFNNLTPGTTYYFVVRARDTAGNRDGNTVVRNAATLTDTTPPTFAGVTTVTGATFTALTVNWAAATDDSTAAGSIAYLVCRSTSATGCTTNFTATAAATGTTSHTFTGLTPNTTYHFLVRARDAASNVDSNSVVVSGATLADTTPPSFTGASTITGQTQSSLTFSWSAATDNLTPAANLVYDVCFNTSATACAATFTVSATTAAGATSYTLNGLNANTTYHVLVRARDAANNRSTNTTALQGTTLAAPDTTAPSAPGSVTANRTGCGTASVSWQASTDNVTAPASIQYQVCVGSTAGQCAGTFTVAQTVTGATSINLTNITGANAFIVVRARDGAGNTSTGNSEASVAMADSAAPTFGTGTTVVTPQCGTSSSGALSLDWPDATDSCAGSGISYEVCELKGTRGANECTATNWFTDFTASASSLTISAGLTPSTSHSYYVRSKDGFGNVEATSSGPFVGTTKLSLSGSQIPSTWSGTCSACHSFSYATTVNFDSPGYTGFKRILPNSTANSVMYQKVIGTSAQFGQQMPQGGPATSSQFQTELATWINEGACNN